MGQRDGGQEVEEERASGAKGEPVGGQEADTGPANGRSFRDDADRPTPVMLPSNYPVTVARLPPPPRPRPYPPPPHARLPWPVPPRPHGRASLAIAWSGGDCETMGLARAGRRRRRRRTHITALLWNSPPRPPPALLGDGQRHSAPRGASSAAAGPSG